MISHIANIAVAIFLFYIALNLELGGYELILGGILAGLASSYGLRRIYAMVAVSILSIFIFYLLMISYYYVVNPYGAMVMLGSGLIILVPFLYSLVSAVAGGLVWSLVGERLKKFRYKV